MPRRPGSHLQEELLRLLRPRSRRLEQQLSERVRPALAACATTLAGKPAAGSTQRRKRSVFYNALGYAVELGRLGSNPVDRIQWTAPAVAASVDRRVVVSPAHAGTLLTAGGRMGQRGERT